jgi:CheY-like chemotaxis protein
MQYKLPLGASDNHAPEGKRAAVLDLMMPEVDGFAVLDHARGSKHLVPVIVLSGRVLTEDVKRLDHPRILYQTKRCCRTGTIAGLEKLLTIAETLPQPTSILVKQALAYLHQNYGRDYFEEITETVGTSRSYASRIFPMRWEFHCRNI